MRKYRIVFSILLLVLPTLAAQSTQGPSADAERAKQRQAAIVGLVRTINTAEVAEATTYGSFGPWQTLLAHFQENFNGWLGRVYPQGGDHFGDTPEILPGWSLRLQVNPDGQGYVVSVEEANDETGFAVVSDERGRIRVCKYI